MALGVDLGRYALMVRRPPWTSSMIAMALLACGESVARAQKPPMKSPEPGQPESCGVVIESRPPVPSEVIYQEYKDGKLTYEVTAPPAQIRALGMPPVMIIRPLDCPEAPRPAARPRSKSGQRRAHARWGR